MGKVEYSSIVPGGGQGTGLPPLSYAWVEVKCQEEEIQYNLSF